MEVKIDVSDQISYNPINKKWDIFKTYYIKEEYEHLDFIKKVKEIFIKNKFVEIKLFKVTQYMKRYRGNDLDMVEAEMIYESEGIETEINNIYQYSINNRINEYTLHYDIIEDKKIEAKK